MPIKSEIIADSISSQGCRLTSYVLEYPRFIHSEIMTHRVFSKNASSSRAIPIEKMIEMTKTNPAMPVWWGKNQSGMQAKEELDDVIRSERRWHFDSSESEIIDYLGLKNRYLQYNTFSQTRSYNLTDKETSKIEWLLARNDAISRIKTLNAIGLHKQIANRTIEPWLHIRVILSGTEFENFFALRAHPDAQPEFQALAYMMLEQYNSSKPNSLNAGEWHIPFGDKIDQTRVKEVAGDNTIEQAKIKVAIARCARISYLNFEGKDDYGADIKLCDRLFGSSPKHLSPTEHVAQCTDRSNFIGNFRGWKQFRKTFADEVMTDSRVIKTKV